MQKLPEQQCAFPSLRGVEGTSGCQTGMGADLFSLVTTGGDRDCSSSPRRRKGKERLFAKKGSLWVHLNSLGEPITVLEVQFSSFRLRLWETWCVKAEQGRC